MVSPAASCVIALPSPLSGRVMLRPIHQLKASPISTAAAPTQMMNCLVRDCEEANAADAVAARRLAKTMILSACGSSCWLPNAISLSRPCVFSARLFHCARLAA
jgi:hypothetical protein